MRCHMHRQQKYAIQFNSVLYQQQAHTNGLVQERRNSSVSADDWTSEILNHSVESPSMVDPQ